MHYSLRFPAGTTGYYFGEARSRLKELAAGRRLVLLTEGNVFSAQQAFFSGFETITVPPGEQFKTLETVQFITNQLLEAEADRTTLLVGVGGGVLTDIAGFAGSIYMRGLDFGFIPTSLLAMVDAAVGGKNGVNAGLYKNMLGLIRQPGFILFDNSLLQTLPVPEWSNGFAEVIKYGCIFDNFLFETLLEHELEYYRRDEEALMSIIQRCVDRKNRTVAEDEQEHGIRKILNFGHTVGHTIENRYGLPHGAAVSIGMMVAARLSTETSSLDPAVPALLKQALVRYGLPVACRYEPADVMELLKRDKKRRGDHIDFILLERIGQAIIKPLELQLVQNTLEAYIHEGNH